MNNDLNHIYIHIWLHFLLILLNQFSIELIPIILLSYFIDFK